MISRPNKSVKNVWLGTYIILFILPLILCIILFLLVDGTIKEQVNNSNYFALKQIQQYMDTLARDTERIAGNIAFSERVQKIGRFKKDLTPEERYDIVMLNRDIVNRNYNSEVEEVYIYFRNIDTVVSSNNVLNSDEYFYLFAERYGVNVDKWIKENEEEHKGSYININSKNKKLAYMLTLPINTTTNEGMNIVVVLDESRLLGMIKDIKTINSGKLAIVAKDDQVVLSSDNMDILQNLKYDTFKNNSHVQYNNVGEDKVAISYINSNVEKWKYLYVMPTREYWRQLEDYRKLVLCGITICLIICCTIAFCLFKKNYEPLKGLLKYLSGYQQSDKGAVNEYGIIKNAIMKSMDERKELDKWSAFKKKVSNDKYLKELLTGNVLEHSLDNNLVDIKFDDNYFSVTAFAIDTDNHFAVLNLNLEEDFDLLHFIVYNMLDELLQNICHIYTVSFENIICCLMNFSCKDEELILKLKEVVIKIQEIVKEHYKIGLTIAIGNIYEGKDFIKQSFKETRQLLEFEEVVGGEDILVYNESKGSLYNENIHNYFYPYELEEALINALKSGDFSRVSNLLEEIFNYNLKKRTLSSNMAQCLKCNIISTLISTLDSIINSTGEKYNNEIISIEQLVQCKSMYKVKERLLVILQDICEKISNDKKVISQIGEDIIYFVKENYKEEDLNISVIANKFDLHPTYLSKLFKLQIGEGLLDYINKIRIDEAKKLIKSEKSNLECIAKKVGYSNVKTFTRIFTKIEGITPGKYREV